MLIRPILEDDSQNFLDLCHTLDRETQFMLFEPGERTTTVEEQRQRIRNLHAGQLIWVAEEDGRLVGFLAAFGGNFRRNRHSAYIVIGILQAFTGRGLGKQLFMEIEKWARRQGIHRLELTVMAHNERGVRLYRKMGFEMEGIRKHSLKVNGEYVDEYAMAKLLD
jgi:RimJ/RimL family protein N-acetyltransferase